MIRIRESFGAKLLSALIGTVGLLLLVTFAVVRVQTGRVVEDVTVRALERAGTLFDQLAELRRRQLARITYSLTGTVRAAAMLAEGDSDLLAEQVDYQVDLDQLGDVVVVFTDREATPLLSWIAGERVRSGDPVDVVPLAQEVLEGTEVEVTGYRVVTRRMYAVRTLYTELARRPVGTVTVGAPVTAEDVASIGAAGGFEVCFHADRRCVVTTPDAGPELLEAMEGAARAGGVERTTAGGREYVISSAELTPGRPSDGARVIAVPLDEVLGPFGAIQNALLGGGAAALLLSGLLGAALSRSLTRPIRDLVSAAHRVAEGDYDTEVRVDARDEVGTLAQAFNEMTHGLLLREQYRSVLNKVVSQDVATELLKGQVELGGETREISVLFADIRGFTPMTEGMEPQEVIALLNDCMERMSRAVDAEGGIVDKFIGDEVMAVFGAPVRQEDHAARAVRAAIRMRTALEEMNRERVSRGERPLEAGIGVNTGRAVAGNMGANDRLNYTVLGETVNLAARLVNEAKAGQILVSGQTHGSAGPGLVATPVGRLELKGFSAPVDVFEVSATTAG